MNARATQGARARRGKGKKSFPVDASDLEQIFCHESEERARLEALARPDEEEATPGIRAKEALDRIVGPGTQGVVYDSLRHRLLVDTPTIARLVFEESVAWVAYRGEKAADDSEYPMSSEAGVQATRLIVRDVHERVLAGERPAGVRRHVEARLRFLREQLGVYRLGGTRGANATEYGVIEYFMRKSERLTSCIDASGHVDVEWSPRGNCGPTRRGYVLWIDLGDPAKRVVQVLRDASTKSCRLSTQQIAEAIEKRFDAHCSESGLKKVLAQLGSGGAGKLRALGVVEYLRPCGYKLVNVPIGAPWRTDTIE